MQENLEAGAFLILTQVNRCLVLLVLCTNNHYLNSGNDRAVYPREILFICVAPRKHEVISGMGGGGGLGEHHFQSWALLAAEAPPLLLLSCPTNRTQIFPSIHSCSPVTWREADLSQLQPGARQDILTIFQ